MADDQNQRPYRSNETLPRATPAASAASGSDPLAELARLIGQNDPFAEFGRANARRAAAPPPTVNWSAPPAPLAAPAAQPSAPEAPLYGAPDGFRYQDEAETAGHPAADTGGFEPDPNHPSNAQLAGEEEDFYDDVPPAKRRMGIMAIAAVFALAVIGTAGAFGYRALFGTSGPSQPPPVIKADIAPSKIVPVTASKAPNKLITDRVADHAQDEKLVSREEQPFEMKDKPAAAPPPQAQGSALAALGSGVLSSEPKKIRTIAIRPDQPGLGDNQPVGATATAPAPPPPQTRMAPAPTAPTAPPAQVASNPPVAANPEPPPPRQSETRAVAPAPRSTASSGTAPLSLSPDASAAPAARAPMRTAAVAAPTPIARAAKPAAAAASGSYAVQVSSQRSEADAQAAFRSLQAKFPNQLGGKQALIHKVELGDKGIYYRAMVGPFANANEASELCSGLKAAGGQCIVQRN